MGYKWVDAEDIIRADSARQTEIVAGFDPEVVECLEDDASRHAQSEGKTYKHRRIA